MFVEQVLRWGCRSFRYEQGVRSELKAGFTRIDGLLIDQHGLITGIAESRSFLVPHAFDEHSNWGTPLRRPLCSDSFRSS